MWPQRSKVLWLKEGDKNRIYFHDKASKRWKKNFIHNIHDSNGDRKFNEVRDVVILNYFQHLFFSMGSTGTMEIFNDFNRVIVTSPIDVCVLI